MFVLLAAMLLFRVTYCFAGVFTHMYIMLKVRTLEVGLGHCLISIVILVI